MGVIPPWSDLPQELLSAIAEFLITNPIDILSFRSVCKSWCSSSLYSSLTLFPPLPLTTPSPPYSLRQSSYCLNPDFSVLSVTVIYALRPPIDEDFPSWMPRVWVLFLDQSVPGKAKFNELALVDQVGALKLMREALKFMKETFKLKELLYGFKRLQQQKKSVKLHDQEGTSTLATEERPASADSDCDWFSVETNFNACILQFEENTSNLEVAINKKKYCAPAE